MNHIISVLVENEFGVLSRVVGLFSGRGFNIESLNVAATKDPKISRITIVTKGDDQIIEQIKKQLNKLINVIKVLDMNEIGEYVARELALIRINPNINKRSEVINLVNVFRGKIISVNKNGFIVEITGDYDKLEAFMGLMEPYGITEIARTGILAMSRENRKKGGKK
jgi:acetolactate synthase-1/3 small subunit